MCPFTSAGQRSGLAGAVPPQPLRTRLDGLRFSLINEVVYQTIQRVSCRICITLLICSSSVDVRYTYMLVT